MITEDELVKRFSYHPFKDDQRERFQYILGATLEMARVIVEKTPYSREQSLALTHLEEVVYHATAAMVRNE